MGNVYGNPYEPDYVKQRPRFQQPQKVFNNMIYDQIQTVQGFDAARDFASNCLAAGASYIIAEGDPNIARIYMVSKDHNGVPSVSAFKLIPEEEPKQPTMQDLSNMLQDIQNRINKLEEKANNEEPVYFTPGASVTDTKSRNAATDSGKPPKVSGSNVSN